MLEILKKLGFSETWCKWIEECITKVPYTVVVNSKKKTKFRLTRGIRKGDPLSPYMFILVANVLSRQIIRDVEKKRMEDIRMKRTCPDIHHLLFNDDSIFFMKAT